MLSRTRADLVLGWRLLWRTPWLSTAAILTLAIGIGANTAVFSLVNQLMFTPPPGRHVDRTLVLGFRSHQGGWFGYLHQSEVHDMMARLTSFAELGSATDVWVTLTGGPQVLRLPGLRTGPGFLTTLGVEARLGRVFGDEDFRGGAPPVCLLTHDLWRSQFGEDPAVLGRTLGVNGVSHTVVGVLPRGFKLENFRFDVLVASTLREPSYQGSYNPYWPVVGRLREGVSPRQALAEYVTAYRNLPDTEWRKGHDTTPTVKRLQQLGDPWVERQVAIVHTVAGFILLISVFNVANLLLAKARQRWREMAVRSALGASPRALWTQALLEQSWLAALGAAAGLLAGHGLIRFVVGRFPGADWGLLSGLRGEIRLDARVLGFALAVTLLTVFLVGLGPALLAARARVSEILQDGSRGASEGRAFRRFRWGLVGAQLALTTVLLILGGLFLTSLHRLTRYDYGLRYHGLLQAQVDLPFYRYESSQDRRLVAVVESLVDRLRALPGVRHAAFSQGFPAWSWGTIMRLPRTPADLPLEECPRVAMASAAGEFMEVFELPVLRGEPLTAAHNQPGAEAVCLIGRGLVERHFPDSDPLGQYLEVPAWPNLPGGRFRIIGVTNDLNRFWADEVIEQIYIPFRQVREPFAGFVYLDVAGDPASYFQVVRETIREEQPEAAIRSVARVEDFLAQSDSSFRFLVFSQVLFAALGLVLAGIGVFGVVGYGVVQRGREIGIRLALCAAPRDIRRMILRESLGAILPALLLGAGAALTLAPFLHQQIWQVNPRDPVIYLGAIGFLLAVALAASWWPARRAARQIPAQLFR